MFSTTIVNALALFASVAYLEVSPVKARFVYNKYCGPSVPCPTCPAGTTKKMYFVLADTDDENTFPFTFSGNFLSFDPHHQDYCFDESIASQYRIDPSLFDLNNPFQYGGLFDGQLYFAGGAYSGNNYADDVLAKFKDGSDARKVCSFKEDGHYHVEVSQWGTWCKDNNNATSGCVQDIVFDQDHSFVKNVQVAIECCMGCGNGILEPGEECDDGNQIDDDGCSNTCTLPGPALPVCGNGVVEVGEECDDGNQDNHDWCSNSCKLPVCGNGIVEGGEACDDGNTVDDDGCHHRTLHHLRQ